MEINADMVKGALIIIGVIGVFLFLRWLMKPDAEARQRAEEFNKAWEEEKARNAVAAESFTQSVVNNHFNEGNVQHRPRPTVQETTRRPPPPPPPMRDGRGRAVPLSSHTPHHHHDDNFLTGLAVGVVLSGNDDNTRRDSSYDCTPSRGSEPDYSRSDSDSGSSSSSDSSPSCD